jgi:hypothetical protein
MPRYHLLGGVTTTEAESLIDAQGHAWDQCSRTDCEQPTTAVAMLAQPGTQPSAVGRAISVAHLCADHEADFIAMVKESDGYVGSTTEIKPITPIQRRRMRGRRG